MNKGDIARQTNYKSFETMAIVALMYYIIIKVLSIAFNKIEEKLKSMIKVVNLKKQFGDNVVLKVISVTVTPGEAISVIGPSGSGKSTFLRCINGLEEITDGHIYVDELDIIDPKNANIDTLRERVGMVFQSFNLFPHLSVTDNITLAPIYIK